MYSLGMVYIACFTGGQSVIQASHSTNNYFKLAGQVSVKHYIVKLLFWSQCGLSLVSMCLRIATNTAREII